MAVVVPMVAIGAVVTRPSRPVDPASVAHWPDRRDPVLRPLADGALAQWEEANDLAAGERVKWLYAGRVAETAVVAFATCDGDACSRAVVSTSGFQPGDIDIVWEATTRRITTANDGDPLSAYLAVDDPDPTGGPRTAVFVLAEERADTVTYASPGLRPGTGGAGTLTAVGGAFAGLVGHLSADVTITVSGDGEVLHTGTVGEPGAVGFTRFLTDDGADPPGYVSIRSMGGQLRLRPMETSFAADVTKPYTVFLRCEGTAPVRVVVRGAERTVPCDGTARQASGLLTPDGDDRIELWGDDRYTAFQLALMERA